MEKEREEDKLHQFLMGIDETLYGSVKSSILSRNPLPTLDEVYNVLTQDEESKLVSRILSDKTEEVSFMVQISTCPRLLHRGNRHVCASCGKMAMLLKIAFARLGILIDGARKLNLDSIHHLSHCSHPLSLVEEELDLLIANFVMSVPYVVANYMSSAAKLQLIVSGSVVSMTSSGRI